MSDISCRNRASAAGTFKSGLFWNVNLNEALFLSQAQSIADNNKKVRLEAYISTFQSVPLLPVPPVTFKMCRLKSPFSLHQQNPCHHPRVLMSILFLASGIGKLGAVKQT
jgi:hypothetical protein